MGSRAGRGGNLNPGANAHRDAGERAFGRKAASYTIDVDDCWVMTGRFTPVQGAVIWKALEQAADQQFAGRSDEYPDVSAETPRGGDPEHLRPQPVASSTIAELGAVTEWQRFPASGYRTAASG